MAALPIIKMPEPEGSHLDFVVNEDRQYFEAHPSARFYDRAPHPSEFWPKLISAKGVLVRVFQITSGYRIRIPYREGSVPDPRAVKMVKAMRRLCKKNKISVPPRDDKLADLHFVVV